MITHIALIKLVHSNAETIEEAREVVAGMAGKIPQLRHFEVGANVLPSYRSFDLAVVAKFDSLDDLEAYQNHPVHIEVLKYLQGVRKSVITVDYETS